MSAYRPTKRRCSFENDTDDRQTSKARTGLSHTENVLRKRSLSGGCCWGCVLMLRQHLQHVETYFSAKHDKADYGREERHTKLLQERSESDRKLPKTIMRTIDLEYLSTSANKCGVCALLMSAIRANDDFLLPNNASILPAKFGLTCASLPFLEDGGTDVESIIRKGNTPEMTLRTTLIPANGSQELDPVFYSGLKMKFCKSVRRRRHDGSTKTFEVNARIFKTNEADGKPNMVPIVEDSRKSGSEKMELLQDWVMAYRKTSTKGPQKFLPRRLLDISQVGKVVLVDTTVDLIGQRLDKPSSLPYVAISHRWGSSRHLTTTLQNIEKMQRGVNFHELPLTFRDAAAVTKALQIDYLWIDALCIIQNSPQDWLEQSRQMGTIFRNATVTVVAHAAGDDAEGFLATALQKQAAAYYNSPGQNIGLCVDSDCDVDVTQSALSKRGWVLQERFLSLCMLHFTPGQIYFETETGIACENGPLIPRSNSCSNSPGDLYDFSHSSLLSHWALPELRNLVDQGCALLDDSGPLNERTSTEWLNLIEIYSHCDLTMEEDKLMAIAGIARMVAAATNQKYCSGIWGDIISPSLLWLNCGQELSPPVQERAPSWSWATWDGPIQHLSTTPRQSNYVVEDFVPWCELVSLKDKDGAETAWLEGPGMLMLRGRIVDVSSLSLGPDTMLGPHLHTMKWDENLPETYVKKTAQVTSLYVMKAETRPAGYFAPLRPSGWIAPDTLGDCTFQSSSDTLRGTSGYGSGRVVRYFLVVGAYTSQFASRFDGHENPIFWGIFLSRSEADPGVYRRHGVGQLARDFVDKNCGAFDRLTGKCRDDGPISLTTVTLE